MAGARLFPFHQTVRYSRGEPRAPGLLLSQGRLRFLRPLIGTLGVPCTVVPELSTLQSGDLRVTGRTLDLIPIDLCRSDLVPYLGQFRSSEANRYWRSIRRLTFSPEDLALLERSRRYHQQQNRDKVFTSPNRCNPHLSP